MPFLSPAKLLVILVVALVVLGPDKLPKVAKQIGGLWGDFRKFREKLESEVRGNFPDLPSTDTITQAVRSPLSFLDGLAQTHDSENGTTPEAVDDADPPFRGDAGVESSSAINWPIGTVIGHDVTPPMPTIVADSGDIVHSVRSDGGVVPDDPGMN
jgi:TatA/E family protein of Tat protein translocase